ncbi:MAG TPA: GvpL/GvpF family gas vesicle protein [Nocardioidaceae bacterium]|nr:GvpL/GvpF family gas vesicle protein [Nocardioidaceae bacterium]
MAAADAPTEAPVHEACYVYGVVAAATAVDDLSSSDGMGNGISLIADGSLAAVVESIDPDRPLGVRRDVLAHSAVLNDLAAQGPVLPMRFGSVLADETAVVTELLRPHRERFVTMLDEIAGMSQFTVRARYVLDAVLAEVVAQEPEVAELRRRTRDLPEDATHYDRIRLGELVAKAVEGKREVDGQRILEKLAPYAADHAVRDVSGMEELIQASFAVHEKRRQKFEAAAEDLAEEMEGRVRMSLVGPMALYDFIPEE